MKLLLLLIMLQTTPLKIMDIQIFRDGGTREITTNKGIFFLDHRISSETKNKLYYTYPGDKGSEMVKDTTILYPLKKELAKRKITLLLP